MRYMEHAGARVSRAEFEANLAEKIADRAFTDDAAPLLATGVDYDAASALERVQTSLISLLPGEPWKGVG